MAEYGTNESTLQGQADIPEQHGRRQLRDSFADMDAEVSLAVAAIPGPPQARSPDGEMTLIVVDENNAWTEHRRVFSRQDVQKLIQDLVKPDGTGKGLFLEDGLKAVGIEDLFDALATSSLRRVYWCRLDQRDSIAVLKRLNASNE